jgi:hypothetical protein
VGHGGSQWRDRPHPVSRRASEVYDDEASIHARARIGFTMSVASACKDHNNEYHEEGWLRIKIDKKTGEATATAEDAAGNGDRELM